MTGMEDTSTQRYVANLTQFLVPIAAVLVFAVWFSLTPPGLLGKADAVGYAICHRIGERSFHIGDRQLPLCARCTGEFYSAAISLIFFAVFSKKQSGMPGWKLGVPLLIFFAAFGIDGSNSFLYLLKQTSGGALSNIPNLYIPNNTLRLFTGSGMGIALASILYPAFNQSAWKDSNPGQALDWKKLGILIGIILLVDLAILTESPIVLYPIAILSVLGVLALLVTVFSMVWLLIMRQENEFTALRQMWLPFLAGTTLAFLMISAIDLLRFRLTGTWGGFPLG
jgi:Predicted membrane protein